LKDFAWVVKKYSFLEIQIILEMDGLQLDPCLVRQIFIRINIIVGFEKIFKSRKVSCVVDISGRIQQYRVFDQNKIFLYKTVILKYHKMKEKGV